MLCIKSTTACRVLLLICALCVSRFYLLKLCCVAFMLNTILCSCPGAECNCSTPPRSNFPFRKLNATDFVSPCVSVCMCLGVCFTVSSCCVLIDALRFLLLCLPNPWDVQQEKRRVAQKPIHYLSFWHSPGTHTHARTHTQWRRHKAQSPHTRIHTYTPTHTAHTSAHWHTPHSKHVAAWLYFRLAPLNPPWAPTSPYSGSVCVP